jgi:hypothetical protein
VTNAAPEDERVPGLGAQIGRTKGSLSRLLAAHIALLKAELGDIVGQLKVLGTIAGMVLVLALLLGNMLYIGGALFIGEWLFGSIGWGLAHGSLLVLALMVVFALVALGAPGAGLVLGLLLAAGAAIAIALLLGSNVAYTMAADLALRLSAPLDNPGAIAALGGAIVAGLGLLFVGLRLGGLTGGIAGLVVGLIVGAPLGWLMGAGPWTWPPAAGLAITIGLLLWPILQLAISWPQLDVGKRFSRLYPRQSIEAANETKAWLEEQWRKRRPTPGTK